MANGDKSGTLKKRGSQILNRIKSIRRRSGAVDGENGNDGGIIPVWTNDTIHSNEQLARGRERREVGSLNGSLNGIGSEMGEEVPGKIEYSVSLNSEIGSTVSSAINVGVVAPVVKMEVAGSTLPSDIAGSSNLFLPNESFSRMNETNDHTQHHTSDITVKSTDVEKIGLLKKSMEINSTNIITSITPSTRPFSWLEDTYPPPPISSASDAAVSCPRFNGPNHHELSYQEITTAGTTTTPHSHKHQVTDGYSFIGEDSSIPVDTSSDLISQSPDYAITDKTEDLKIIDRLRDKTDIKESRKSDQDEIELHSGNFSTTTSEITAGPVNDCDRDCENSRIIESISSFKIAIENSDSHGKSLSQPLNTRNIELDKTALKDKLEVESDCLHFSDSAVTHTANERYPTETGENTLLSRTETEKEIYSENTANTIQTATSSETTINMSGPLPNRNPLPRANTTGFDTYNTLPTRSPRNPHPNNFHSYNTHFSTTCLPNHAQSEYNEFDVPGRKEKLGRSTGSTAQLFSFMSGQYDNSNHKPSTRKHASKSVLKLEDSHLLYRTGSRLWEESRESRGQSWLGTRASSTALNQDDDQDDDHQDYKQNEYNPKDANNFKQQFYDSDEDEDSDDDGVLHIGGRRRPSAYLLDNRKEDQDEVDIIVAESRNKNRLIRFADWILGLGDDSSSTLSEAWNYQNRRVLTKEEKIQIREEDSTSSIDVAMGLAILAYIL